MQLVHSLSTTKTSKLKILIIGVVLTTLSSWVFAEFPPLYMAHPAQTTVETDHKLHLYLCGTGAPQATMQQIRKPACLAIIADNDFMLFDAGEGTTASLAGMGLPIKDISNIFITHWHSDHIGGLGSIINESWLDGRGKTMNIYGPQGVNQVIEGLRLAYTPDASYRKKVVDEKFAFGNPHVVQASDTPSLVYQDKVMSISSFKAMHEPVNPAVGYIIEYQRCKIIVSGDTKVNPVLANNIKGTDLLVNEAMSRYLIDNDVEQIIKNTNPNPKLMDSINSIKNYHSDSIDLAKIAESGAVKNLVLTHLIPVIPSTDVAKKQFATGMDKYYTGNLYVANDMDEVTISKENGTCVVNYQSNKYNNQPVKNPDETGHLTTNSSIIN